MYVCVDLNWHVLVQTIGQTLSKVFETEEENELPRFKRV